MITPSHSRLRIAGLFAFSFAVLPAAAASGVRQWHHAGVTEVSYHTAQGALLNIPAGHATTPVRTWVNTITYHIASEGTTYVVVLVNKRRPLNIKVQDKIKVSVDGRKLHILDDVGKDIKVSIHRQFQNEPLAN